MEFHQVILELSRKKTKLNWGGGGGGGGSPPAMQSHSKYKYQIVYINTGQWLVKMQSRD